MSKRRNLIPFVLFAVVVSIGMDLALGLSKREDTRKPQVSSTDQVAVAHGPTQNVRFTLYNSGIYPRRLHAKPGIVLIGVEDRTGNTLGLVIQRQVGNAGVLVGQVKPVLSRLRGQAQFSLGAGHYTVVDAGRPNNQAELVVEP